MRGGILPLSLLSLASGCGFRKSGGTLPLGHVALTSCPNTAPTVPYMDASGEATVWPDLIYEDFAVAKYVANLSSFYKTPLCYFSQQVLPSPPTGADPGGNCTWTEPPPSSDVLDLLALASQAIYRMDSLISSGAFRGSQCGSGSSNIQALCAAYPDSQLCVPALLTQKSRWAVASNIVEITAQTLPTVIANDTTWRSGADWHVPAMASNLVRKGWGSGGAITFKVVPCASIPPTLVGEAFDCDQLDAATGRAVWDEAFAWWSSFEGPAWLREELGKRF
jgi:hypothetical protein